jgi:lipopolysaccharide transport system ATP-binding protein
VRQGEVAREGRTVLFVRHQLAVISTLCHNAMLLHGGHVVLVGLAAEVVGEYLRGCSDQYSEQATVNFPVDPDKRAQLLTASVLDGSEQCLTHYDVFDPLFFRVSTHHHKRRTTNDEPRTTNEERR